MCIHRLGLCVYTVPDPCIHNLCYKVCVYTGSVYTHNSCVYTDLGCVYTQYRIRVYTYLCIHKICVYTGSVYTHNSCVYTDLGCVYTQYMICVYTDPVYTHDLGYVYTQDLCIHIIHVYTQTWVVCIHSTGSVYTHICVYTGSGIT